MRIPPLPILPVIVVALFTLPSCQLLDTNASNDEARILFGKSIDGVEIGVDSSAVIELLDRPDYIGLGDFYGVIFAYVYPYSEGPGYRDSLTVTIFTNPRDEYFGVVAVTIEGPYSGRTRQGIGIGSSREAAIRIWGQPDDTGEDRSPGRRVDVYEAQRNAFKVRYSENMIHSITMVRRK